MAAITGDFLKITLRYTFMNQKCQTGSIWAPENRMVDTITAAHVGEAWWNHVKTSWRALIVNYGSFTFDSVIVEELGGNSNFGEYAIPPAEQLGTRAPGTLGEWLPSYCAVGVRLAVGTRVTRPGQKRFPGLTEGDNSNGTITAAFQTLVGAVAAVYSGSATLGAPALAEVIHPVVATFAPQNPVPVASQRVIGYLVNPVITSQVSRKIGRGQ